MVICQIVCDAQKLALLFNKRNNIFLLIIGIFIFVFGISWSKKDLINFILKLLLLASGGYVAIYALYLSNILIVLNI